MDSNPIAIVGLDLFKDLSPDILDRLKIEVFSPATTPFFLSDN